ncbi:putative sulfate exporter family transporter [Granulicatella sp. zg-ZJ]|uniref:YeiH family protein n=1 Tax=Granulicatella sp. zg-ZJ TaxID=2678504 RepID=UPI0013D3D62A|nr:putative sulfate exporter family transporter [Granulicatella sp. zg-ZJ]NEW62775.1 putative sulfate exporter family transporter [Granulicatella sp. zg-ZJ]
MKISIKPLLPGVIAAFFVTVMAKMVSSYIAIGGPATLAILLGILFGNTVLKHQIFNKGTKFSESKLLECSVVLLGFTVTFQTISQMGINGVGYIFLNMSIVLIGTYFLGRRIGFNDEMSLMMAGGNAVCGSSAIGAIAPAIHAKDDEKGQIVTLVNLLGTVMMLTLPFLATALFQDALMSKSALLGGTLQSVGQVVAGASLVSEEIVKFAMLYKMTRIMCLVFVVYACKKVVFKKHHSPIVVQKRQTFPIPWYVCLFLLICLINSTIGILPVFVSSAKFVSSWFETIALAAIGLRLDIKKFLKEGPKFAIYGLSVGLFQVVIALFIIFLFHIR